MFFLIDFPFDFNPAWTMSLNGTDIHDYLYHSDLPRPMQRESKTHTALGEVLLEETVCPCRIPNQFCSPSLRPTPLHVLKDTLLELPLNLLALLIRGRLAVQRQQVAEVELGCLEQLDLADVNL